MVEDVRLGFELDLIQPGRDRVCMAGFAVFWLGMLVATTPCVGFLFPIRVRSFGTWEPHIAAALTGCLKTDGEERSRGTWLRMAKWMGRMAYVQATRIVVDKVR